MDQEAPRPPRAKKSRKIFDPADHEQPVRKRGKISSSSPPPALSASFNGVEANVSVTDPYSSPPGLTSEDRGPSTSSGGGRMRRHTEVCTECGSAKNKLGKKEALVRCRDCPTIVHPSCLDYSEELARKILSANFWQCINCKTCSICDEADPLEDEHMLFCDSCDLGYHMNCHLPPIASKPPGKWICYRCQDASTVRAITRSRSQSADTKNGITITNGAGIKETLDQETARFLPLLPPHLHPHTGLLPPNWEDYPMDPSIPDVSDWEPINVMNYFMKQGFPTEHAAVFLNEEIDGSSLLLLHRQDVIGGLGLKLGPALKVFNQVKKLQTKRNIPLSINVNT